MAHHWSKPDSTPNVVAQGGGDYPGETPPNVQDFIWNDLHSELERLSKAGRLEVIAKDSESFTIRLRKGGST